jgi:hypothetical protein
MTFPGGRTNPARALGRGIPSRFRGGRHWPAASDVLR